jgi:hypothetical protein
MTRLHMARLIFGCSESVRAAVIQRLGNPEVIHEREHRMGHAEVFVWIDPSILSGKHFVDSEGALHPVDTVSAVFPNGQVLPGYVNRP